LWVDFAACDDGVADLLLHEFGFHPRAVETCRRRAHMPTFHGYDDYDDYWFVVIHRPLWGTAGHVHLLQLERGPYNPEVDAIAVGEDTGSVRARLDADDDLPFDDRDLLGDLSDRFSRLRTMADAEREFLAGVIDYYQTRTTTKLTLATERLAVLAAITLPITAIASVYGMNVIVGIQRRATSARMSMSARVGGDRPSAPGGGLSGLNPRTRGGSSSCTPAAAGRLTGLRALRPRSSAGMRASSVTTS
jgi:hypothetical protein